MKLKTLGLLLLLSSTAVANDFGEPASGKATLEQISRKFKMPAAIAKEHEELHQRLKSATQSGGATRKAAQSVAKLLHPHFEKEELYAMPPLGLLPQVSAGTVTREMEEVLPLTDKLKTEMPQMLQEHKTIVVELEKLRRAAQSENKPDVVKFVDDLQLHAKNEEEVLYPTSLLIGELIRAKLQLTK